MELHSGLFVLIAMKVNDYVIEIAFVIVLIALFVVALKIFGVWV